jgi:hypothetical protein
MKVHTNIGNSCTFEEVSTVRSQETHTLRTVGVLQREVFSPQCLAKHLGYAGQGVMLACGSTRQDELSCNIPARFSIRVVRYIHTVKSDCGLPC